MRTQYCREHIDKVAEGCGLSHDFVVEVKNASLFADGHPEITGCGTEAIRTIMAIRDAEVQDLTISHIKKVLNEEMPRGGKKYPFVTTNQIKAFKARFELQVNTERQKAAEIRRKEAEVEYKRVKEIADAEEKKHKDAESLGVVLKIADPERKKTRESVIIELNRLKSLLEDQTTRREEQQLILDGVEARYLVAVERANKCREGLLEAERKTRDLAGYRTSVIKEIQAIDKNSRNVTEQIAAQTRKLQV